MYRLTINDQAFGDYNEATQRYNTYAVKRRFTCESVQQLMGLIEFMVVASDNELDLTIGYMEDDDE